MLYQPSWMLFLQILASLVQVPACEHLSAKDSLQVTQMRFRGMPLMQDHCTLQASQGTHPERSREPTCREQLGLRLRAAQHVSKPPTGRLHLCQGP